MKNCNENSKRFEKLKEETKPVERFVKLAPETPTGIEKWRTVIKENFPDLLLPAEIGLSVIAQLLIKDIRNPFGLIYVDMPSSGKTIVLNFFSLLEEIIYTTDNLTPASFVSHAANVKKDILNKQDLLPNIRYKTLMVRDFAPMFAKRDEDVEAAIGVLIRIFDGEGYEGNSGVHGKRGYKGDYLFMLLGASTPIRPKIWKAMGNLGGRLFFLNMNSKEKSGDELAKQLLIPCQEKEQTCRTVTSELLKTLWSSHPNGVEWDAENTSIDLLKIIGFTAKILARLRASINSYEYFSEDKRDILNQLTKEMPDRLNRLLYNLARSHAIVCQRKHMTTEDLSIVIRVAIDSAPLNRVEVFKQLLEKGGILNTENVMEILKCKTRATALKMMKEFVMLDIATSSGNIDEPSEVGRPTQAIHLKKEFDWFLSEEFRMIAGSGQLNLFSKSDAV